MGNSLSRLTFILFAVREQAGCRIDAVFCLPTFLHCVEKPPPILRLILPLTLAFAKLLCRTFSLPAGTCSTFVCPFGMTHFANSSKAFCITSNCTEGECCTAAPLCTTFTSCLASGKVLVGDASSKYCAEVSCIESECCTLGKNK